MTASVTRWLGVEVEVSIFLYIFILFFLLFFLFFVCCRCCCFHLVCCRGVFFFTFENIAQTNRKKQQQQQTKTRKEKLIKEKTHSDPEPESAFDWHPLYKVDLALGFVRSVNSDENFLFCALLRCLFFYIVKGPIPTKILCGRVLLLSSRQLDISRNQVLDIRARAPQVDNSGKQTFAHWNLK